MREPNCWISLAPWLAMAAATLITFTGCQNGPSHRTLTSAEPTLSPSVVSGTVVSEGSTKTVIAEDPAKLAAAPTAVHTASFADRHPLFSRPREYYESTGNNKVVKTAAAVVVGVPAGIVGELKQIVVGAPAAAPAAASGL